MMVALWISFSIVILAILAAESIAAAQGSCNLATAESCSSHDDGSNNAILDATVQQWIDELPTENSMYLDGAWMKPTVSNNDDSINVIDPSTGQQIATVSVASKLDVDMAVVSARQALEGWSIDTTLHQRRKLVYQLYKLYQEHREQMAQLISHEMGAPIELALDAQVGSGSYVMENFLLEVGDEGNFEAEYQLDPDDDEDDTTIYHEAIGVVGLITPWNWPMNQIALKVIPALLVGCTVILKPSEETPLSALLFGKLIHMAGFPSGVFQLVNGYGPGHVGEWLASHPGIDMVSFTGSTRAGKQISATAAPTLKRVSLEMGGKGANIIFEDLGDTDDFYEAIESGVESVMSNSGQTCNAPTRMLVPAKYWDYALEVAKEVAWEIEVDSAHEGGDHIGPVVSETQYERIQSYIRSGIDEGATLLVGGLGKPTIEAGEDISDDSRRLLQRQYNDGYYVQPTIFANCSPEMTIWKEEIFGPVLCITKYDTEEEAIRLANDSPYGLTHYAQTYDKKRQKRLARKLQSGMVVINQVGLSGSSPFGGVKQSGNSREGGEWGLLDFCIVKAVSGLRSHED
mmetsp:Transcript_11414/g.24342  ORF Transcript_11414/g.24342 Transcript_11414/m.24342 type:complete len:573 (-) Transcript_11414:162-1880(-)